MKLWDKTNNKHNELMESFTIGNDKIIDLHFAQFDILASYAHALMLEKIKIINTKESAQLGKEFYNLYQLSLKGKLKIEDGVEDIHSQIEFMLTKTLGDLGKKIHTARSRNDQILVALKLYAKYEIESVIKNTNSLFNILIAKSEQFKNHLLPGYTHFQVAMPSSFGLWFGAYAESLTDDLHTLLAAYKICNQSPLGSGAGFGTSFPIDRIYTSQLLGFETLNFNVVYAQMTRGKFEKICVQALSNLAATLNKFACDATSYCNENHQFITLPESLTTGSSIMPHKKNPDALELIRGYTNKIASISNELTLLTHNLPSGYHREMQLTKSCLVDAFATLNNCLQICTLFVDQMIIKINILDDKKYEHLFSVEAVNDLVMQSMPFREAYNKIAQDIKNKTFLPQTKVQHTHEGSIGNLSNKEIELKMEAIIKHFEFDKTHNAIQLLINKMNA